MTSSSAPAIWAPLVSLVCGRSCDAPCRAPLLDLTEFATREEFVYSHVWRVNDFMVWDNRSTMHRGRRFDPNEARDIRQTRLAGDDPTIAQTAV